MAIFNSYVKLPEGIYWLPPMLEWRPPNMLAFRQDTKKSNRSQPRQQCNGPQTVTQRPQENWVENEYKYIV